jgi:tryptophan synthase alpha chain
MSRVATRFAALKAANRPAFIPFITAGDPDPETSFAILEKLPAAGADLIELGVPFSDPMSDGPAIQASSMRALNAGMSVKKTLGLVERFRRADNTTPLVLMGYYNPIHAYGPEAFARDAGRAGVDGLITVDLGPEEDSVLRGAARTAGIDIVRLVAPTTGDDRLAVIARAASGFIYYVSIAGVTGTKTFDADEVKTAVARVRRAANLPCAVGFGIRDPGQAAAIGAIADAAVVGSAIVSRIADSHASGKSSAYLVEDTLGFCRSLAGAVHGARGPASPSR